MKFKEFFPSSWAIDNKTSIYVLTVIITLTGILSYMSLPKESFPDIVVPTIFVQTVNAGNSPTNIENTITKPIEKKLKSISGIKKVTSTSMQDISVITAEFNTNISPSKAKLQVQDAVDDARGDLPQTLTLEPRIKEIAFSEMPIMYVNIAGNYDLKSLKKYAEDLEDKIESMKEITEVKIVGGLDREIQVNLDMYKMQAANLTIGDVQRAIQFENMSITAGNIPMDGMKRTLSIKNEFTSVEQVKNLIIGSQSGAHLYLKDIADVDDTYKEAESYASLAGKNVITLQVIKKAGENLIEASDKIRATITDMQKNDFPEGLKINITGDQSDQTRVTLHDLINTIVIGFILVTLILMFFMGVTNALFVALSVPLSMFIAFLVMPSIGFTLNMIVLFGFLLALGIVVDDAIVVIENTHRIYHGGQRDIKVAAKMAAGEVFLPVLSGTITTLAPFIPLAFWSGIIGKFMFYLPITLIISLLASLFVAYIINPVFAVDFMADGDNHEKEKGKFTKGMKLTTITMLSFMLIFYVVGNFFIANLLLFLLAFYLLNKFILYKVIDKWQNKVWPAIQHKYVQLLTWCVKRPYAILFGTLGLFVLTIGIFTASKPQVVFFPQGDPNNVYIYVNLPVGTDPAYTNMVMKQVEQKANAVIGKDNPIISSTIVNVTVGVTDPADQDQSPYPNKGKISINFVKFSERNGESTMKYLQALQNLDWNIPGADIFANKEQAGPPVSKPINIEVRGEKFEELVLNSNQLKRFLDSLKVPGVVEIKSDFQDNKPEIVFDIDRERANREGISTGQIGMEVRNALFGIEASKFRDANDEYPIQVRYKFDQRINIEALRNLKITYRDMNMGGVIRSVPLSSVCKVRYDYSYGGIKRKNNKRVITLSSDVKEGFNANEVTAAVKKAAVGFNPQGNVEVAFTGQEEEQAETGAFLGTAMMVSIGLILLVLVIQFNSFGKPLIILTEIFFSVIGVLLGVALTGMEMSIVMTGVGIIALAGIVVRNGILLVDFAEKSRAQGNSLYEATIDAGRTRMTPVILTALAAILGLIPLAVGLNIDFYTLFSEFKPHLYFGGDSVVFWGPLAWTMIFGLSFATFLTLLLVPAMYLISERLKIKSTVTLNHFGMPKVLMYVPFLFIFLLIILKIQGKKLDYGNLDH